MEELGFRKSDVDPCLFISPTVTLVCYYDYFLLLYKDEALVNTLTKQTKDTGMIFEEESDGTGYLGVLID